MSMQVKLLLYFLKSASKMADFLCKKQSVEDEEVVLARVLAITIFVCMFAMVVWEKIEKHYVTLACAGLTLVGVFGLCMHNMNAIMRVLNVKSIFTFEFWYAAGNRESASSGINWETILFLFGMMVMVEGMAKAGFFRWLCLWFSKLVKYRPIPLFITFMVMSAVLSMFIDSITVILFLAAVSIELGKLLKINPVPMILSEIFCANLGGSATMCGDPPNIIIGTSLGYSFADFFVNTGLIVGVALVVTVIYLYFAFRKELCPNGSSKIDVATIPTPREAISSKKEFIFACVIFALAIVMLVTHSMTGFTVALIGIVIAAVTLLCFIKDIKMLLSKVDYKILMFFIGLFVVVGGLEETGILELIAEFIGKVSGGNVKLMIAIIIWVSAFASAFVDNIPFSATMIPIIKSLAATQGVNLEVLAWTLSMGTDIGGSASPIGASANVVGMSVANKNGYKITWGTYCKKLVPITLIVITLSMLIIFVRYL